MKGKQKIFQVLKFIENLQPEKETNLDQSVSQFKSFVRRRGIQVFISDFYDFEKSLKALKSLSFQNNDVFLIHVIDKWEEDPGLAGEFRLFDIELPEMENVTITRPLIRRYKKKFEEHVQLVESFCRRNEWGYLRAGTYVPYDELILSLLRRSNLVG